MNRQISASRFVIQFIIATSTSGLFGCSSDSDSDEKSTDSDTSDTATGAIDADGGPETQAHEAVERARELVAQMTLEEKVSQMGHEAPAIARLGIPAYNWWNEALHGVARSGIATVFPQAIALASTFDPELIQEMADVASTEARIKHNTYGKNLTYWSPTVNLARDPRWGRNEETYGEDPYLASKIAASFIRGMQGNNPKYLKTVSTPKHFIANNEEIRRHSGSSDVDERNLREHYMPAFKAAITEGGAFSVMCAYNALNGIPSCANKWLLTDVLRGEWGFKGYVVSDCWAIHDIVTNHHYSASELEASDVAIAAGTDLNCGSRYQPDLVQAVQNGLVSEEEIDTAVTRLFTARFKLGEFDPVDEVPYNAIPPETLDAPEHHALALKTAQKSMVLLKNDGILPLNPSQIETLAVIGPNANRLVFGGYSGDASNPTTPLGGIRDYLADFDITVTYSLGSNIDAPAGGTALDDAAAAAAAADAAIVVLGIDLSISDEALDRTDIGLPAIQMSLLEAVFAANPDTIAILVTGAPLAIPYADENLPAILNAWYGGQAAGQAIADILFGAVSPSGRLPQTFYRSMDDLPAFDDYDIIGGKRTYMYIDGPVLYPFGHGLSYTQFEYTNLHVSPSSVAADETFTVTFDVTNVGEMDGDEVAQVYVKDVDASVPVAHQKLRGFKRISLQKQETTTVSATIEAADLGFFDTEAGTFVVEPGAFQIRVGASSEDIRLTAELTVSAQ